MPKRESAPKNERCKRKRHRTLGTRRESVGNPVQDVALATKALEEARKRDLGVELEI